MATILIVEDDHVLARQMAHTLRQAGHVPIMAGDARAALRATRERPEAVLLDLDVPELSMEGVLAALEHGSGTARIPLLIVTGQREAIAHSKATGRATVLLRKPVSGVRLRESVDGLLGTPAPPAVAALHLDPPRQRQLILHLIAHAPDSLALQISRRLCLDRMRGTHLQAGAALTWEEIAIWGRREGLLDPEQAQLLSRMPAAVESRAAAP